MVADHRHLGILSNGVGSDGSAPDVYPNAEPLTPKPVKRTMCKFNIGSQLQYYREKSGAYPDQDKGTDALFSFFFLFFFLRLEAKPLRHMVSELV